MKTQRLVIHDTGPQNAPAVLFLHGFPFTRLLWRKQVEALSTGFRCIDYDLRGFGENPSPDGITTIERHADDLLDIVAGLKRRGPLVLCGHSLGGCVALRALVREPALFAGLVVCGAHARAASDDERLSWSARIRSVDQRGTRRFLTQYLGECFVPETREGPDYDVLVENAHSIAAPALKGAMLAMMARTDTLHPLEQLNPPLLLMAGAEDSLTAPEALLRMGLGISGAQFVRVPRAAHAAPLDNPEFVSNALRHFLESDAVRAGGHQTG